ncbi:hypothetical protein CHS0354_026768 [Potamilus streckersoni]|uniref:Lipid IV(A) 3-deoxy-D-manno-octulosonic acid transferase n=1 Tax=Potamilus streckersoni TaxID=2493646 RepID=A0AAE0W7I6_9BIVA|nr:hypothetical protein CHS0354_026768 [Potamilus streckersoni]
MPRPVLWLSFLYLCLLLILIAASPLLLVILSVKRNRKIGDELRFVRLKLFPPFRRIPPKPAGKKRVWIHGASLGEVQIALNIFTELYTQDDTLSLYLTTGNLRGFHKAKDAAEKFPDSSVFMLPFDFALYMRCLIRKLQPDLFIITETEMWPHLLIYGSAACPAVIYNARISDKTIGRYRLFSKLFKKCLKNFRAVFTSRDLYRSRFAEFYPAEYIRTIPSMKFIQPAYTPKWSAEHIRQQVGAASDSVMFVCGSVQAEEVPILMDALSGKELRGLHTVIVPRNLNDCDNIKAVCGQYGYPVKMIEKSDLNAVTGQLQESGVTIVNAYGVLRDIYAAADIVFVGGSLCERGGQNFIEPLAIGIPTFTGNKIPNFIGEAELLQSEGCLPMVSSAEDIHNLLPPAFGAARKSAVCSPIYGHKHDPEESTRIDGKYLKKADNPDQILHSLTVKIKKTNVRAVLPVFAYEHDAGADVTAVSYEKVRDNVYLLDTGIAAEPPAGYYLELHSRSGICKTDFIQANQVGIIDPGYRGSIKMPLRYIGSENGDETVQRLIGTRIGQLILRQALYFKTEEGSELSDSLRGVSGFGSSGN